MTSRRSVAEASKSVSESSAGLSNGSTKGDVRAGPTMGMPDRHNSGTALSSTEVSYQGNVKLAA